MVKNVLCFIAFIFLVTSAFAETLTITTYYPSPYGSYNHLQASSLGVGDNNGNNILDSGDVPTTAGDVWIKGKVGIGNSSPAQKLDVTGYVKGTGFCIDNDCRTSWPTGVGNGTVVETHNTWSNERCSSGLYVCGVYVREEGLNFTCCR